jgi:ATP-dependent DNA ligase
MPVFLTGLAKESRKDYIPYLIVFDILEYGNNDTIESYRMREQYKRSLYVENFIRQREFKYIKAIETFEKDFDGLYNGIIACGGEGIVLKRYSAVYQEGKRSADWLKVKRQETHDCFIIGLMKGEGKYADTFGSLVLGQFDEQGFLVQCGACSGFSDDIRRYLYDAVMAQPEACVFPVTKRTEYHYVRRVAPKIVVEVECMERYDTGAMRHPRFLRIRTDKDPSECRYNG